jgi:serine/threonine protein kinase
MKIGNCYITTSTIGSGTFGTVYKGIDLTTNNANVAIKVESKKARVSNLLIESKILNKLRKVKGFPRLFWYGSAGTKNAMVMELLGKSLGAYLR